MGNSIESPSIISDKIVNIIRTKLLTSSPQTYDQARQFFSDVQTSNGLLLTEISRAMGDKLPYEFIQWFHGKNPKLTSKIIAWLNHQKDQSLMSRENFTFEIDNKQITLPINARIYNL